MTGEPHKSGSIRGAVVAGCVRFTAIIALCTPVARSQDFEFENPKGAELSVSTITIASRESARGAEIAVPVTISTEGPAPTTIVLIVEFDDSRLSYLRSELGSAVPSGKQLDENLIDDVIVLVILGLDLEPIVDGTLLILYFEVADDAPLIPTRIAAGLDEFGVPSSAARGEEVSGGILDFSVDIAIVAGEVTPFVGPPPIGCGAVDLGRLPKGGTFARHWGDIAAILGSVVCLCATGSLRRSALR